MVRDKDLIQTLNAFRGRIAFEITTVVSESDLAMMQFTFVVKRIFITSIGNVDICHTKHTVFTDSTLPCFI
jgi:hypothetical protein